MKKRSQTGETWSDQWDRMVRWHGRLDPIRRALPETGPAKALALDEVFAFFMNCYHLGDWVKKDSKKTEAEVNTFVFGSDAMRLCRDVCNGLKHYELQSKPFPPTNPNWSTATEYPPTVVSAARGKSHLVGAAAPRWVFTDTVHGSWDMFQLADECVEAWRKFLGL